MKTKDRRRKINKSCFKIKNDTRGLGFDSAITEKYGGITNGIIYYRHSIYRRYAGGVFV